MKQLTLPLLINGMAVLLFAPLSYSDLYKCKNPDGTTTFSEVQCSTNPEVLHHGSILSRPKNANTWGSAISDPDNSNSEKFDAEKYKASIKSFRSATQEEIDQCVNIIKESLRFKDPDSVKYKNTQQIVEYKDGRIGMVLFVNAKNSYGGYTGEKAHLCERSADGKWKMPYLP